MWDQSWLGIQPQSPHFTIICCPGVTQISRWLPKALSAGAAGMLLGRIHIHIHCIWRLSNTLHVSDIDVLGSILFGSTASITALHHHLLPRSYPDFDLGDIPKLCQQGLLECCKDTSIFTSTAYEGCQTPCMCLTLMCWDQSWLGLQPQSLHFTIICCPGVTQISRWIPKAWSTRVAVIM
jgi:hypothetical protein